MTKLVEVFEGFKDLVMLEGDGARKLDGVYLKAFKNLLSVDWDLQEIYYSGTSLIIFDIDDYEGIKEKRPGLKDFFKLESQQFNLNLYVVHFMNDKELSNLFGGAT